MADRAGNRIEVLRDELNTALEVRHSGGYRVSIDSSPNGRVTALHVLPRSTDDGLVETDPHGSDPILVSSFEYDEKGFLTSVLDPSDRPMRFEYDDAGRIVRWEDRNGMWYRYEYDAEGRCVRSEGRDGALAYRFSYDRESGVTEAIDSFGARTVYRLNDDLQVVAQIDPLGATTLSEWDIRHQLLARTDAVGATTRFTYDTTGDLLLVEGPDGVRTTMEYAAPGLVSAVTGPDGSIWRRRYDDAGAWWRRPIRPESPTATVSIRPIPTMDSGPWRASTGTRPASRSRSPTAAVPPCRSSGTASGARSRS